MFLTEYKYLLFTFENSKLNKQLKERKQKIIELLDTNPIITELVHDTQKFNEFDQTNLSFNKFLKFELRDLFIVTKSRLGEKQGLTEIINVKKNYK